MRVELCLLMVFCSIEANCIPVGEFFSFGTAAGDVVLSGDSVQLFLNPLFPILEEEKTSLIVRGCMCTVSHGPVYAWHD